MATGAIPAAPAVNVCVEAVLESQIQEVRVVEKQEAQDGQEIQEIYAPPLSMSENLTKLAQKIDFYKDESGEKGKPTSEGEKEREEEKSVAAFQPSLWPWDSVRNKLKTAYTEMSVLLDVLNIAKEKRYMVLDSVQQSSPDAKLPLQLMSKKKALNSASTILLAGAERLKKSQAENSNKSDFHFELLKLRQNWRLKKSGNTILGDLSYRSVGSRYPHNSTFEVVKSTDLVGESGETTPTSTPRGSLEVIIPSELEGTAYIQVEVKSVPESLDLTGAILKMPSGLGAVHTYWQQKLEVAQNVLFCKEIFAQLAREAVQSKSSVPHLVVGNQIITNIFPGIQLSIVLCHSTGKEKDRKIPMSPGKLDHNHVLEHSLHQLLREVHNKNLRFPAPHPVTAMVGVSKKRRLAGPNALSRRELVEMTESDTMLNQIIKQTKHNVLRLRTLQTIDAFATTLNDPQLTTHWSCANNSLEASCRVFITSQGYDLRIWHSFVLMIGVDSIKIAHKDGRIFNLSFEEKELQDFILWQIAQHQTSVSQNLARMMGWQIMSTCAALGVSDLEDTGIASSLLLASPDHDRVLAVKSGPSSGVKVFVQSSQKDTNGKTQTLSADNKWQYIGADFKEVDLSKFEGKNFASKLELLMATLSRVCHSIRLEFVNDGLCHVMYVFFCCY